MHSDREYNANALEGYTDRPIGENAFPHYTNLPKNVPKLAGSRAARKLFFGVNCRYAVWPIHTRFNKLSWFVYDYLHPSGKTSVIRQEDTLSKALEGLI